MFYFLSVFTLYVFTLHPSVSPYRDSGDLIAAAYTIGVAHPSGYPLYVLLGKIFTLIIPFGNIAYRINLMSAFFGALTCWILYLTLYAETKTKNTQDSPSYAFQSSVISLLASLILAFSVPFWRLSGVSEMYTLNTFFAAVMIFFVTKKEPFKFYLLSFLMGLACGNHLTIVFLIPAIFYFILKERDNFTFSFSRFLTYALFFAIGFSGYLLLPIRAHADAVVNWGDPDDLKAFIRVLTRADYGGLKLHPQESEFVWTARSIFDQLLFYLNMCLIRFTPAGMLLGVVGLLSNLKNKLVSFAFISFLFSGPFFTLFSNLPLHKATTPGILEPHFLLPDLFFAVFIFYGIYRLKSLRVSTPEHTEKKSRQNSFRGFVSSRLDSIFAARFFNNFAFVFIVIVVGVIGFKGLKQCNYRYDFYAHDYGKNLLITLPPGSILYDSNDATTFITDYFNVVSKKRTDIHKAVYFRTRWGYERLKKYSPQILPERQITSGVELASELIKYNRGKRDIFAELPFKFPPGLNSSPQGLLYKLTTSETNSYIADLLFDIYAMRGDYKHSPHRDFFTNHIISYYSSARTNIGLYYFNSGDFKKAYENYLLALAIDSELPATNNNLGTLKYFQKDYKSAEFFFKKAASVEPDSLTLYNLGMAYKMQKDYLSAEKIFTELLCRSYNLDVANDLGLTYYHMGRYKDATRIFYEIIKKDPSYANAYYNLGLVYLKTQPERANDYFQRYEVVRARN